MKIVNGNQLHLENDKAVYVHVGDRVIYIDNSTGEMLVEMWADDETDQDDGKVRTLNREEAIEDVFG